MSRLAELRMSVIFQKDGKTFEATDCFRQLNLLAHAQMIELDIGSRCGGFGECGGDRIQVDPETLKRLNPLTEAERKHLSEDEIRDGMRLACQVYPRKDGDNVSVSSCAR